MTDEELKIRQDPPATARISRKMVLAAVVCTILIILLFATFGIKKTSGPKHSDEDENDIALTKLPEGMQLADYKAWLSQKQKEQDPPVEKPPPIKPGIFQPKNEDRGKQFQIPEKGGSINVMPITDTPEIKDMIRKLDYLANRMQGLENRPSSMAPQPQVSRGVSVDTALQSAIGSPLSFSSNNLKKMMSAAQGASSEKPANQDRSTPTAKGTGPGYPNSDKLTILDQTANQGMQGEKRSFLNGAQRTDETIYMVDELHYPKSQFELKASSIIPVTLYTGINSDLPGRIVAKVRNNVYDTIDGDWLLIPQGSSLVGEYDSIVAYGQERVLLAFSRIIFPNGNSINLEGAPGIDLSGYAGLKDKVNHHFVRLITGVVLTALVTASASEAENAEVFLKSAADQANEIGQEIADKNLNIAPTITIRPGWKFNVFIHKDMILEPYTGETIFAKATP